MSLPWYAASAGVEFFNTMPVAMLLAAATALVLRVLPGGNASTRYAAWWLCLAATLALPVARQLARTSEPEARYAEEAPFSGAAAADIEPPSTAVEPLPEPAPLRDVPPVHDFGGWRIEEQGVVVEPGTLAGALLAVWAAGALFGLFGLLRSYIWIRRRIARGKVIEGGAWIERCLARCPPGRRVQVRWSDEIGVPVAVGFLRPTVLLPSRMAWRLEESEIEDIVVHELAHLARRDDWAHLAERVLASLLWFHPLVRWVMRRIEAERELCCDDWVVRSGAQARSYAASLVKLAEFRRSARLALAATASKPEVSRRVEALLKGRTGNVRISTVGIGMAALLLAALTVATARIPGVLLAMPAPQEAVAPPSPPSPPSQPSPPAMPLPASSLSPPNPAPPRTPASPLSPPAPASSESPASPPSPASPVSPPLDAAPLSPPSPVLIAWAAPPEPPNPPQGTSTPKPTATPKPADPKPSSAAKPLPPAARPNGLLAALRATGYGDLSVDEIVDLKNNGVSADLLLDLQEAGVPRLTARELVQLHQQGVGAGYLHEMLAAGIPGLTIKDVVYFRQNNVDSKLVRAIRALGYGPYTPRQIVDLGNNGVNSSFFEELKSYGITQIDARDAIDARNHGVNGNALREARQYGPNLSIRQIIKLKSAGVI